MKKVRAERLYRMSQEFLDWDGEDATELYGIGKYGSDSYRLFFKKELPEDVGDHELISKLFIMPLIYTRTEKQTLIHFLKILFIF